MGFVPHREVAEIARQFFFPAGRKLVACDEDIAAELKPQVEVVARAPAQHLARHARELLDLVGPYVANTGRADDDAAFKPELVERLDRLARLPEPRRVEQTGARSIGQERGPFILIGEVKHRVHYLPASAPQ